MVDLLRLQNQLKNLSDEDLQFEVNSPSGSAPQFLVLSEIDRRKGMREDYEAEQRRRGEGRTTVREDIVGQSTPSMALGGAPMPAGPPAGGPQAGLPSYADGGPVSIRPGGLSAAPGYGRYRGRIDELLASQSQNAGTNRAMGILEAGLGIAAGQSPNFATNVARGGLNAAQGYRKGMADNTSRELELLRTGASLAGQERSDELRLLDLSLRDRASRAKKGPQVLVQNVGAKQATEYAKVRGKKIAEQVDSLESRAIAGRALQQDFSQLQELLANPDVYTGTFGQTVANLKRFGSTALGLDFKGVADADVSQKVRSAAIGKIRELVGDERMSDADREFYLKIIPNLGDDPESIRLATELMGQAAEANEAKEIKLHEFMAANPTDPDKGWREYRQWAHSQQIWSPEVMALARDKAKKGTVKRGPTAGTKNGLDQLFKKYNLE